MHVHTHTHTHTHTQSKASSCHSHCHTYPVKLEWLCITKALMFIRLLAKCKLNMWLSHVISCTITEMNPPTLESVLRSIPEEDCYWSIYVTIKTQALNSNAKVGSVTQVYIIGGFLVPIATISNPQGNPSNLDFVRKKKLNSIYINPSRKCDSKLYMLNLNTDRMFEKKYWNSWGRMLSCLI